MTIAYIWEIPFIIGMLCGVVLFILAQYLTDKYQGWKKGLHKAEEYYQARWKNEKKNL